jgi:hypothetical protein
MLAFCAATDGIIFRRSSRPVGLPSEQGHVVGAL